MTLREVANTLLRYIGVTNLDPAANIPELNVRGLNSRDIPDVAACIQGAAQELYELAPADEITRQVGDVLRPPAAITLTVTQYSTACVITGFASWMLGCTVTIAGDTLDNRIVSATELLRPYMGASGSVNGTVYADCLTVSPAYCSVIEPVEFPNRPCLVLVTDRERFRYWNDPFIRTLHNRTVPLLNQSMQNKTVAEPVVAMAEFEALGTATPKLYLRFNPMPGQAYAVTYTARLAPPVVTVADIWNEATPTVDPGVSCYLANAEATLLPFALQRWTAHPSFSPEGQQLAEIGRQYQAARRLIQARRPMIARQQAIYAA